MKIGLTDPEYLANWRTANGRIQYKEGVTVLEKLFFCAPPNYDMNLSVEVCVHIGSMQVDRTITELPFNTSQETFPEQVTFLGVNRGGYSSLSHRFRTGDPSRLDLAGQLSDEVINL